ncbi:class I SAM-dependent methyltransferase [Flexivirga meconopsidis]|uniref:class I SAM-dependent methyltransferase n=1 Tax=Flexivirga meconopsidis TaxID=2977121 RepID=UPI00223F3AB1|nr:class I SAM-dependent methyltransferase [Flexivirga meconopsidis]
MADDYVTQQTCAATKLDRDVALRWLRRWDDQQGTYFVDREQRFAVIADVVQACVRRDDPLIVDLGVGPGSLASRLLRQLPGATVVGVDLDPLLLGLAASAYGSERFRVVAADLSETGWLRRLGLDRAPDAFVSTTALHWLPGAALATVVHEAVEALAPGGVFVDGDHFYEPDSEPRLDDVRRQVAAAGVRRTGRVDGEDWSAWWAAAHAAPELAELSARRERLAFAARADDDRPPATRQGLAAALRAAGCAEAGAVWQHGDDYVMVGVR